MSKPQIITLVRIKSWYIPGDAEAYQALKAASVPLLIFHKDFLPTLQLATRRHNIKAKERVWSDLYGDKLDAIGAKWNASRDRSCRITDNKLVFFAKATAKNRAAVATLEAGLAKFFARWSFRYYPTFSETPDKYKLVVEFRFDPELVPIVPVVTPEVKREYDLVLGFTRIRLTFYDKPTQDLLAKGLVAPLAVLEVATQTGDTWFPVHTSTFKSAQIKDVSTFMGGYAELFNRMRLNE